MIRDPLKFFYTIFKSMLRRTLRGKRFSVQCGGIFGIYISYQSLYQMRTFNSRQCNMILTVRKMRDTTLSPTMFTLETYLSEPNVELQPLKIIRLIPFQRAQQNARKEHLLVHNSSCAYIVQFRAIQAQTPISRIVPLA